MDDIGVGAVIVLMCAVVLLALVGASTLADTIGAQMTTGTVTIQVPGADGVVATYECELQVALTASGLRIASGKSIGGAGDGE